MASKEEELLALLQKQAPAPMQASTRLPDLSPEMLMSPAAIAEMRAAMGTQTHFPTHTTLSAPVPNLEAEPDPSLETLFMEGLVGDQVLAEQDSFFQNFSFEPDESSGVPNEAARFQIGRESPPASYFDHTSVREAYQRPTDGTVVGQRGRDGRWTASAAPRSVPRHEAVTRFASPPSQPIAPRPAPQPAPAPAKTYVPSAFERIAKGLGPIRD